VKVAQQQLQLFCHHINTHQQKQSINQSINHLLSIAALDAGLHKHTHKPHTSKNNESIDRSID